MAIKKHIEEVLEKELKKRESDADFQKKRDYLEGMRENGLILPQKYGIPALDTIGKRRYLSRKV